MYDHITGEFIGTIITPTIFVDPMTKSFVEVLYEETEQLVPQSPAQYAPVAPVPHQSPAQYTSVAPVSQRSAPVYRTQSKLNITVNDIQFHSTRRWSCSGKSYSGLIETLPFNQEVYLFKTQRFIDPQKLVEFLNFCESVNQ